MENYNYLEQVTADAKEAILENMEYWNFDDREELEEVAYDVTIRCYLLGKAIAAALDELEEEGKISYPADEK